MLLKQFLVYVPPFQCFVSILNYMLLKLMDYLFKAYDCFVSILNYMFLKPQKVILEIIHLQGYVIYNSYGYKTSIYLYYI